VVLQGQLVVQVSKELRDLLVLTVTQEVLVLLALRAYLGLQAKWDKLVNLDLLDLLDHKDLLVQQDHLVLLV
jgi:hypothetical protein